jgi:hypothetical protein
MEGLIWRLADKIIKWHIESENFALPYGMTSATLNYILHVETTEKSSMKIFYNVIDTNGNTEDLIAKYTMLEILAIVSHL